MKIFKVIFVDKNKYFFYFRFFKIKRLHFAASHVKHKPKVDGSKPSMHWTQHSNKFIHHSYDLLMPEATVNSSKKSAITSNHTVNNWALALLTFKKKSNHTLAKHKNWPTNSSKKHLKSKTILKTNIQKFSAVTSKKYR